MLKKILILSLSFGFLRIATAQNIPSIIDWPGKAYSHSQVLPFVSKWDKDSTYTFFDAGLDYYMQSHLPHGIKISYNGNYTIQEVQLFDKGSRYERYQHPLPQDLKWGMNIDTVFNIGLFELVDKNHLSLKFTMDHGVMQLYFSNDKLSSIKVTGNAEYLKLSDNQNLKTWGRRVLPNGKCINGDCEYGTGTMVWGAGTASQATYKGEFKYGMPHGNGRYETANGILYRGGFNLGFFWGEGNMTMGGQYSYIGNYAYGKRNGEGKIKYEASAGYEGSWVNDTMEGKGKLQYSSTTVYTGQMADNMPNGFGKLASPDGSHEGYFKNGRPHGKGTAIHSNGGKITGTWKNGVKNGEFIFTHPLTKEESIRYFRNDEEYFPEVEKEKAKNQQ